MTIEDTTEKIRTIENSIIEAEPYLSEEAFKDYCDNAQSIIAYWRLIKEKIKQNGT